MRDRQRLKPMVCVAMVALAACLAQPAFPQVARLCPQPQHMAVRRGGTPLDPRKGCVVQVISPQAPPVVCAAERLRMHLQKLSDRPRADQGAATIAIGAIADWKKADAKPAPPQEVLDDAAKLSPDGYVLDIQDGHAWIVGKDARGAAYGVETLIQLTRAAKPVPALQIRDWPDTAWRLSYVAGGGKLTEGLKKLIDRAFHYKLNMLVFENGELYHLDKPENVAGVREVFGYCRRLGIEPIPELQSFGWSQFVLPIDPVCVEATPWEDRRFRFGPDGVAVPHTAKTPREVVISNPGLEEGEGNRFAGWRQDDVGKTLFAAQREPGNRCLRIARTTPGMSRLHQTVPCEPRTDYALEVDMRTQAGKGYEAYFEAYGGSRFIKAHKHIRTTTGWQRRRLVFHSGESSRLTIYLRIQDGVGQAWFDNVACTPVPPPPMVNVVRAEHLPVVVKSADGKRTFAEGTDYDVLPGELRFPFKRDTKPWRIRRKPGGSIKPGHEVLVSYHWAKPEAITYCPSEPRTHAIMKEAVQRTIRLLKPRFVHIGHDEPRIINVDARCRRRGLKAHELFADDIKRIHGYAREADPGVRLMMWADALRVRDGKVQIAWHSKEVCALDEATRGIPKDIIMCRWIYSSSSKPVSTQINGLHELTAPLLDAGYDVTVSPWYDLVNTYCWAQAVRRLRAKSSKCRGLFLTTWSSRWQALPLCADLMWTLSSPHFAAAEPGTLKQQLEEAMRPFQ